MDLRYPIGTTFTAYGLMLGCYGYFTRGTEIYKKSLGLNVNLIWGAVLIAFGLMMAFAAVRANRRRGIGDT